MSLFLIAVAPFNIYGRTFAIFQMMFATVISDALAERKNLNLLHYFHCYG